MDGSRGVLVDEVALGNGGVGHFGGLGGGDGVKLAIALRRTVKRATAGLYIITRIAIIIMHDATRGIPRKTGTETGTVCMLWFDLGISSRDQGARALGWYHTTLPYAGSAVSESIENQCPAQ